MSLYLPIGLNMSLKGIEPIRLNLQFKALPFKL
jgi:hypothetical protein